jgi:hypothetical protein
VVNKPTRSTLSGALKTRINRLAHAAAIRHETATRQQLLNDLQRLASAGADLKTLETHLDNLESTS